MSSVSLNFIQEFISKYHASCMDVGGYSVAVSESFGTPADALTHYLHAGRNAAPALLPMFVPAYYESRLAEALPPGVSPLEHYLNFGMTNDVSPIALFEPQYIREQEVVSPSISVFDFIAESKYADIDPHPLFSKSYYRSFNTDVAAAKLDSFAHYLFNGWHERRWFHPFFRANEYDRCGLPENCGAAEFNERLASVLESPDLGSANALFDAEYYAESLGGDHQIRAPLQHYLRVGWRLNASPHPLFDPVFYAAKKSSGEGGGERNVSPYIEYLSDFSHFCAPNANFDTHEYRRSTAVGPVVASSLLEHFVRYGCVNGARLGRLAMAMNARPSRHSGFETIQSLRCPTGAEYWICVPRTDGVLQASVSEASEIEPSIVRDFFARSRLHDYSGPISGRENSIISVAKKCARCNCLVVSDSVLEDGLVSQLISSVTSLVSSARPWLTLMSVATPTLRYWHKHHHCRAIFNYQTPQEGRGAIFFVAQVVAASMPNHLVVKTDRFGVALLRAYGSRLRAACPKLTLFANGDLLESEDLGWLSEFVAMNFADFHALIGDRASLRELGVSVGEENAAFAPRIVVVDS